MCLLNTNQINRMNILLINQRILIKFVLTMSYCSLKHASGSCNTNLCKFSPTQLSLKLILNMSYTFADFLYIMNLSVNHRTCVMIFYSHCDYIKFVLFFITNRTNNTSGTYIKPKHQWFRKFCY